MPTALKCHADPFLLAIPFWKVPIYIFILYFVYVIMYPVLLFGILPVTSSSGSPSISLRRPPYDFHLASICGPKLRYKHTKELRIMFPMVWLWIHSNDFHFHILPPHVKAVPSQDSGQSHLTTSATIIMWSEHEIEPHQCLIAPCILSGKSNSFLSFPRPAVLTNSAGSVLALFEESKPSNNFWHLNSSKLELGERGLLCTEYHDNDHTHYRLYTMCPCFMLLNHVPGSLHNCETALFLTYIRGWKIGTMVSSMWSFVFRTTMFAIHLPKHQLLRGGNGLAPLTPFWKAVPFFHVFPLYSFNNLKDNNSTKSGLIFLISCSRNFTQA